MSEEGRALAFGRDAAMYEAKRAGRNRVAQAGRRAGRIEKSNA